MADALQLPEQSLPDAHEAFVVHYIGDCRFNASAAALAAGYSPSGIEVAGHRLLRNARVRARIDEYMDAISMSGIEALAECTAIARAPTSHYQQVINEYTDKEGKHVQVIRQDYSSKVKALELILKARGMLTDRVSVEVTEKKTFIGIRIEEMK